jgi:hypothetical protein
VTNVIDERPVAGPERTVPAPPRETATQDRAAIADLGDPAAVELLEHQPLARVG